MTDHTSVLQSFSHFSQCREVGNVEFTWPTPSPPCVPSSGVSAFGDTLYDTSATLILHLLSSLVIFIFHFSHPLIPVPSLITAWNEPSATLYLKDIVKATVKYRCLKNEGLRSFAFPHYSVLRLKDLWNALISISRFGLWKTKLVTTFSNSISFNSVNIYCMLLSFERHMAVKY